MLVLRPVKGDPPWIHWYAVKVTKIPVGLEFVPAGNGWGMLRTEDPEHPAYPTAAVAERDAAAEREADLTDSGNVS